MNIESPVLQAFSAVSTQPKDAHQLIKDAASTIDLLRDDVLAKAFALGTEYARRRSEILVNRFNGLSVQARKRGRSVQIGWVIYHFKNGKRKGVENLRKSRTSMSYDIPSLKRRAPEELHDLIVEIEGELRPLREANARLTEMDVALKVVAFRLATGCDIDSTVRDTDSDDDDAPYDGPDIPL